MHWINNKHPLRSNTIVKQGIISNKYLSPIKRCDTMVFIFDLRLTDYVKTLCGCNICIQASLHIVGLISTQGSPVTKSWKYLKALDYIFALSVNLDVFMLFFCLRALLSQYHQILTMTRWSFHQELKTQSLKNKQTKSIYVLTRKACAKNTCAWNVMPEQETMLPVLSIPSKGIFQRIFDCLITSR